MTVPVPLSWPAMQGAGEKSAVEAGRSRPATPEAGEKTAVDVGSTSGWKPQPLEGYNSLGS